MSGGRGKTLASPILGILASILCWQWLLPGFQIVGILVAIVGLVLAVSAINSAKAADEKAPEMAVIGLVFSLIGLVMGVILLFACGVPVMQMSAQLGEMMDGLSSLSGLF